MNYHNSSNEPPRTLSERLSRLNDDLQALGERLKASIAGLLGETIADAVRDSVRGLLGGKESPPIPYRDRRRHHTPDYYEEREDDPWATRTGAGGRRSSPPPARRRRLAPGRASAGGTPWAPRCKPRSGS